MPLIRGSSPNFGLRIYATRWHGSRSWNENGVKAERRQQNQRGQPQSIGFGARRYRSQLLINTISKDKRIEREGAQIRRASVERGIPCLTSLDTARALLLALRAERQSAASAEGTEWLGVRTVEEYLVK